MSNPNRNRNPRILLCDAWLYPARRPTASQARTDRARLHALADALAGTDLTAVVNLADALANAAPPDTEVMEYARASAIMARAFGEVQP